MDGKIDLIVTKSVSRFARNTVDSLTTVRKLKEKGVEIYFEKENIWTLDSKGELLITIMSSLAQEESRSISENCTWGQRKRFADGKVTVPFKRFLGYDRGPDGNLVLNTDEAVTVRRIYSVHLFSGKIRCGQCGEWYGSKTWHSTSKYRRVVWQCNHKYDGNEKCTTPHLTDDDIKRLFVSAVNQLIGQKDTIITALTASLDTAFDLTVLKAEQAELESEMAVVSNLIEKCIYENAHTVLDQEEYQKRYDGLTARFDTAKSKYEDLDETIRSKQSRRATIEAFLATLADANLVDTFDTALWCGLVDFVTVYSADDVRVTFKNGMEITI